MALLSCGSSSYHSSNDAAVALLSYNRSELQVSFLCFLLSVTSPGGEATPPFLFFSVSFAFFFSLKASGLLACMSCLSYPVRG